MGLNIVHESAHAKTNVLIHVEITPRKHLQGGAIRPLHLLGTGSKPRDRTAVEWNRHSIIYTEDWRLFRRSFFHTPDLETLPITRPLPNFTPCAM